LLIACTKVVTVPDLPSPARARLVLPNGACCLSSTPAHERQAAADVFIDATKWKDNRCL
jgi:hypothetical protein